MSETQVPNVTTLPAPKKHIFTVKRVLVGLAVALVAAASATIARSEMFASPEDESTNKSNPADTSVS